VPAENCLRPDQQSRPGRSGKALAQGGHDHPIARTPAHPLDLSLQNLHLAAEHQHLGQQLGSVSAAGRDQVEHEAHQRIKERSHHPGAKSYPAVLLALKGH